MIEFLKAAHLSFKICQNGFRLRFLRELAHESANDLSIGRVATEADQIDDPLDNEIRNQIATLRTYRNTIDHWLSKHPDIDSNIWCFETAQKLYEKSLLLIQIGEKIIYGDIQTNKETVTTEPSSGIAEARAEA